MRYITCKALGGRVTAPSSKSALLRALLVASLARGSSHIWSNNDCEDVVSLVRLLRRMGVGVERLADGYRVIGGAWPSEALLPCGESGFLYRSLPFVASQLCDSCDLEAVGTLRRRGQAGLLRLLDVVGVAHAAIDPPSGLRVLRSTYPERLEVPNLDSSQPLSGLLLSLPLQHRPVEVDHQQRDSQGYIDLTLQVMAHFGVRIVRLSPHHLRYNGEDRYLARGYRAEGDWSAAALLLAACAAEGWVHLDGLDPESLQPDRAIVRALRAANAHVEHLEGGISVRGVGRGALVPFTFDVGKCPDLAPALAILAAQIAGSSTLLSTARLENKESNRLASICELLKAFHVAYQAESNRLIIEGGGGGGCPTIDPHHDHRIAMAGALLGLLTPGGCYVMHEECVDKSYPDFWNALQILTYSAPHSQALKD